MDFASVSLDLDNYWCYLKTFGDDRWERYPSYLPEVVPKALKFLESRQLKITFFVVGVDAEFDYNIAAMRQIGDAGHEIACHSLFHDPWLHLKSEADFSDELDRAERAIAGLGCPRPVGFRGPGFSLSTSALKALQKRGYKYDATSFANILNPLARIYFFAKTKLSEEEREQRKALFGTLAESLRPNKPFFWKMEESKLLEIPVTTVPFFKTPFHFSYLIYLYGFSEFLGKAYLKFSLAMCRAVGIAPSLLLHPLDFVGPDEYSDLDFFPGMHLPLEKKITILNQVFDEIQKCHKIVTMLDHSELIANDTTMKTIEPKFSVESVAT